VGRDVLTGDGGADVFFFANAAEVSQAPKRDLITDFTTGVDQIEFSFGPAAKTYIGAAAFSNTAGEIRFVAATGQLQGDFDGNGVADFVLILDGVAVVTATDLGL
jgi:serralysin